LRCQLIPPSQTGHLVLYQTTSLERIDDPSEAAKAGSAR
jgi:hypothetical protein